MKRALRGIGVLAGAGMLSACGITASTMDEVKPRGDAFQNSLAGEYNQLTQKEIDWYDWRDADWFARKTEKAAAGEAVTPEELEAWRLPAEHAGELGQARTQLVSALGEGRNRAPEAAARAQVGFDCWVEEQEENHQPEQIAACKEQFETAMADLVSAQQAAAAEVAPAAAPAEPEPEEYVVHFAFDQATLDDKARATLEQALAAAGEREAARIVVAGHADRAGPQSYNRRLSEQRAQNVARAFEEAGLDPTVRALGEAEPAVPTPDGVPKEENRRAVIRVE